MGMGPGQRVLNKVGNSIQSSSPRWRIRSTDTGRDRPTYTKAQALADWSAAKAGGAGSGEPQVPDSQFWGRSHLSGSRTSEARGC